MYKRFTRSSRVGRGKIPRALRDDIYRRDNYTCQFCGTEPPLDELTIDHLAPVGKGGLDESINYVTACLDCNRRKANMSLRDFAKGIRIKVAQLRVHGDPIIDNADLPLEIRLVRKRVFDRLRNRKSGIRGRSAQKKIEKAFRRDFWSTAEGRQLEEDFPRLPGHARVMLPQIKTIARTDREYHLLIELTKSATTRNLIGSVIKSGDDVEQRVRSLESGTNDAALKKRTFQALQRFEKKMKLRT